MVIRSAYTSTAPWRTVTVTEGTYRLTQCSCVKHVNVIKVEIVGLDGKKNVSAEAVRGPVARTRLLVESAKGCGRASVSPEHGTASLAWSELGCCSGKCHCRHGGGGYK